MREGGDSRYSHSSPKLMTNDECHASFGCHVVSDCFQTWAVGFMHEQSFSCMGSRSRAWAFVFVRGQPFSCVGNRFHVWATVFMCGQLSSCVGDRVRAWQLFPCVGGRLDVWMVVGVGGVVVAHGIVVLWFSWDDSGRVGGAELLLMPH